jgi:hypothetical protein
VRAPIAFELIRMEFPERLAETVNVHLTQIPRQENGCAPSSAS